MRAYSTDEHATVEILNDWTNEWFIIFSITYCQRIKNFESSKASEFKPFLKWSLLSMNSSTFGGHRYPMANNLNTESYVK